ncbi:MAG: hypothetical protein LQ338_005577 [Usnochroma carphineum]|nr:MAG: hypothetical protein LQ338_005577 [Usnochroma carphineum]
MAFQQPVQAPSWPAPTTSEAKDKAAEAVPTQHAAPADTQEWVLFPSPRRRSLSPIRTASTTCTPHTIGLSRLSEFGSFNTAAHSGLQNSGDDALEDDEDLDSLDEGLQAFHEHLPGQDPTYFDHNGSILPTHDGLGTFPGPSTLMQEHLWQFEQTNPQRKALGHTRRRSSVQRRLDALEYDDGVRMEKERMDRIERWRLEHSRILLEEVERESRRRLSRQSEFPTAAILDAQEISTNDYGAVSAASKAAPPAAAFTEPREARGDDGITLYRILQRFVRDFIGIDETILLLLFGEALPAEEACPLPASRTRRELPIQGSALQSSPVLSLTLLNRLSQEVASVLRRLSHTPAVVGSPVNRMTLDYAGIPIGNPCSQQPFTTSIFQLNTSQAEVDSTPTPLFNPTLEQTARSAPSDFSHAALWGIEEEQEPADTQSAAHDKEYWEQTPSIRTIFRLLRQHFTARRRPLPTTSSFSSSKPSNIATKSTVDSLRRASVIRQHHPLVSRQHARRNAAGPRHYSGHSIPSLASPLFKRGDGSCASISSRKSKRESGSSRNYWDIGGSIGSGSVGGIGVWGEV